MSMRLIVALVAVVAAVSADAANLGRQLAPGVQAWQSTIQAASNQFELRGAAVSWPDDMALVTVVRVPEGARRSSGQLQTWTTRLDARDPRVADWAPASRPDETLQGRHGARSLGTLVAATSDRRFVSLSVDEVGITRLTRLDTATEKVVHLGLTNVEVRTLRAHAPNRFLITGSTGLQPFCAETDIDGEVLRKWMLRDVQGSLVVALPASNGDLVALLDTSTSADARFALLRVQADGTVRNQVERAGQAMDLVAMKDGHVAVAYARSRVAAHEVRLMTLPDTVASVRSDVELLVSPTPPTRFRLAAAPQGGVVVAGARERGLWLARLDSTGQTLWDAWTDPRRTTDLELTLGVDLQTDDRGRFLLAYSALVSEGRQQHSVVRTLRFNLE